MPNFHPSYRPKPDTESTFQSGSNFKTCRFGVFDFAIWILLSAFLCSFTFRWGFFAHQKINRLAVFTLPPEMISFYKKNIEYISESAVNPDRRRMAVPEEAPRHYIDIDHYGDSALKEMPVYWGAAVEKFTEDTLKAYGIVPWHVYAMYSRLKDAFIVRDPDAILKTSAELGHYVGDANVPLHTTENYNGQLTGQDGIHGFWESRLPELFSEQYDFFVGRAEYISNVQHRAWDAVKRAHQSVDSVLRYEKEISAEFGDKRFALEEKGKMIVNVYSAKYSGAYHRRLAGMVERQMRASIKMTGDIWYTAWVDAGQPSIKELINYKPSEEELAKRREELKRWKEERNVTRVRGHEVDN